MAVNSNGKKSRKIPLSFEWVLPLFIKPRKTISTIVEQDKPAWLTPLLILSALLLITVLVSGPIRLQQIQSGATLPQDFQYYSEADQQKFLTAQATQSSPLFVYVFPFLSGMLKLWISWFLLGSLLYLSLTLAGSRAGSIKSYNLAGWSFLPWGLRYLVQLAGILVSKQLNPAGGLAGFVSADATGFFLFLRSLMGLIDIYFLFQVALLFIGAVPLSGLTRSKAWIATGISILILMLLQSVPGLISAALGGISLSNGFFFF